MIRQVLEMAAKPHKLCRPQSTSRPGRAPIPHAIPTSGVRTPASREAGGTPT